MLKQSHDRCLLSNDSFERSGCCRWQYGINTMIVKRGRTWRRNFMGAPISLAVRIGQQTSQHAMVRLLDEPMSWGCVSIAATSPRHWHEHERRVEKRKCRNALKKLGCQFIDTQRTKSAQAAIQLPGKRPSTSLSSTAVIRRLQIL